MEQCPGCLQAWKLAKADVLLLCGKPAAALSVALDGTRYPQPVLCARAFAGPFARWLALIAVSDQESSIAAMCIEKLHDDLPRYDALDQVEILCARSLCHRLKREDESRRNQIEDRIRQLPSAVADQLKRLGMIQG